jgi:hypothetical protein
VMAAIPPPSSEVAQARRSPGVDVRW